MPKINQSSVLDGFVAALGEEIGSKNTLTIDVSGLGVLGLKCARKQVLGFQWMDSLPPECRYDYIVADLPFGMRREPTTVGNREIVLRKNWIELAKALRFLNHDGLCVALVEPPAFGIAEGPRFEEALNSEGYYVTGIFNVPIGLFESASFRPVLVVLGRSRSDRVLVGELDGAEHISGLAHALVSEISGDALSEGVFIVSGTFKGFDRLKAEQQLSGLGTQFKEYDQVRLRDIAVEINTVKNGEDHTVKENAVYVPMLGQSLVTHDISQISIKHQNVCQVVLSEKANSEYLSAFFQSQLGKLVLTSLHVGTVIRKIRTSDLAQFW
ncbi:hypothetical protein [Thiocapsa roseopersicina]|uniref:Uncharacterized protein n=1 Tax=Thiocapsa roseopersicina TaxID=1058 RepID=A0A1H2U0A6_THIRO|nr:hypothetical protein [Thiocapsa roseopersicina]SDW48834.1 hypothetical protein SAMN05421783_104228 [Thiocapsa roseopersicina]